MLIIIIWVQELKQNSIYGDQSKTSIIRPVTNEIMETTGIFDTKNSNDISYR